MGLFEGSSVICQLCRKSFSRITSFHLERCHPTWTLSRYQEKFGPYLSDDWLWLQSKGGVHPISCDPETEAQIILGGLYSGRHTLSRESRLTINHPLSQAPYLAWKARALARLKPSLDQKVWFDERLYRPDVSQRIVFHHNVSLDEILSYKLRPLGLAIWFQDIGHRVTPKDILLPLSSEVSVERAARGLSGLGMEYSLTSKRVFRIKDPNIFLSKVSPFVHPFLHYKIEPQACAEVTKRLDFVYGHYLVDYDGGCSRAHGHNAIVEFTVRGFIHPETGMVVDFGDLKSVVKSVLDSWDHEMVNREEVLAYRPTAELLATYLAYKLKDKVPGLAKIRFYETPTSYVEVNVEETLGGLLEHNAVVGTYWKEVQATWI